ncbi:hypothetical protein [Nonomuraea jabiensis]|uniref:hypothetical protein n=1 Tax=Nonomuraea jabiensis TaxID=882448 RepID=UPI0036A3F0E2
MRLATATRSSSSTRSARASWQGRHPSITAPTNCPTASMRTGVGRPNALASSGGTGRLIPTTR